MEVFFFLFVCLFGFLLLVFQIPVKESEEGVKIKYPHIIKKKKKKRRLFPASHRLQVSMDGGCFDDQYDDRFDVGTYVSTSSTVQQAWNERMEGANDDQVSR